MLEGFGEEGGTGGKASGLDFGIFGIARDEENSGSRTFLRDLSGEGAAAHTGHHHVADEKLDGGGVECEESERGFAGVGFNDLKSIAFEHLADEGTNAFIVVDDEDSLDRSGWGGIVCEVELEAGTLGGGQDAPGDAGLAEERGDGGEGAIGLAGRWAEQFQVLSQAVGEAVNEECGWELEFELERGLGVAGESEEYLFQLAAVGGDGDARRFGSEGQERFSGC